MSRALSTFCCSITPFDEKGALDERGLRLHLRRAADAGIGVYVAGSSPGEGYAMSRREVCRTLEIAVEELRGRVPVRAMGVEPRTAAQMVEFLALARDCGVDAAQIYSLDVGHGWKPTTVEAERYYRAALESAELPCIVSSHHFMGYVLSPELMRRLVDDYDHLKGFNVTSPDIPYHVRVLEALDGRAEVHVGGPMHTLTALALGANGFLSTEANFAPRLCASVITHYERDQHAEAEAAYARLMRLMAGTSRVTGSSVRYVKTMLAALGFPGGGVREPHAPLESFEEQSLTDLIHGLELQRTERLAESR